MSGQEAKLAANRQGSSNRRRSMIRSGTAAAKQRKCQNLFWIRFPWPLARKGPLVTSSSTAGRFWPVGVEVRRYGPASTANTMLCSIKPIKAFELRPHHEPPGRSHAGMAD